MTDDNNRRLNFTALDPTVDAEGFERVIASVMAVSGEELASRRARYGVIAELGRWRRPMMAAAAIAAVLCVVALTRIPDPSDGSGAEGIVESLGVPTELAQWLGSEQLPTAADIAYGYGER